jgi:putative membrane protein
MGDVQMIARRAILAAVATTAATSAFAQNQAGGQSRPAPAAGPEARHVQQTTMVGSLSLALSRIAEQKASFPKLKQFSQFEVAEQETVADVLKAMQNPGQVSGIIKPPSESEVEEHLDQKGRDTLQKMRTAQAGRMFDQDYLQAQTDGHEQLLRIQEDYLGSGRNIDSLNVAKLARGMIKEHLALLSDIKKDMAAETTGSAPAKR